MANLALSDFLAAERYRLSEPSSSGRFSDAELTSYTNDAMVQVMVAVEWPEATYTLTTDGVSRTYQLPELYALLRCYVAGQPLVPTDIATMEGQQIGVWDQSGSNYNPQWSQAPFTGFPVANMMGSPTTAGVLPYFTGQRPSYYVRDGFLGINPPPTAGLTISIDVYPMPTPLVNPQDTSFFPTLFKDAIVWRSLMYAYFALDNDVSNNDMTMCKQMYDEQIAILREWKRTFVRNKPNQTMPITHRTYFNGPIRRTTGRSSRFGS